LFILKRDGGQRFGRDMVSFIKQEAQAQKQSDGEDEPWRGKQGLDSKIHREKNNSRRPCHPSERLEQIHAPQQARGKRCVLHEIRTPEGKDLRALIDALEAAF